MRITIESTSKVVVLETARGAVPARIWEGETDSGIKVQCFITRIAHHKDDDARADEFRKELEETRAPSAEMAAYPLRMIL
jgi:hypothetical protein